MRTKFYMLMFLLLGGVSITMAQSHKKTIQILFASDEFGLDEADRSILTSLVQELKQSAYHEINITGHTDGDASDAYNQQLSNRRAQQVKTFLCNEGIPENRISLNWFGENKPKANNSNEHGKSKNRRVEISISLFDFKSTSDLLNQLSETPKEVFEIKANKENKITGSRGIEIVIPANALETEDGKAIEAKNVKIELTEIYSNQDAIVKQISTSSNGEILETGGMFEINASQDGKKLKLKNGKELAVEMPSKNLKEGMNLFVAEKNANGITEWKITPVKFKVEPKKRIKYPFTKVNTKLFLDGKKPSIKASFKTISYYYKLPKPPVHPTIPAAPKRYPLPNKEMFHSFFDRLLISKETLAKRYDAEVKRREKIYQDKLATYNKNVSRYQASLAKYKQDSIAYETNEFMNFKTWLNNQKEACEFNIQVLETNAFNRAIDKFVALNDSNELIELSLTNLLMNLSKVRSKDQLILRQSYWTRQKVYEIENWNFTQLTERYGFKAPISLYVSSDNRGILDLYNNPNSLMSAFISQDPIMDELNKGEDDILAQRSRKGLINQNTTNLVYRTSLSNFGMYNCDKFASYPPDVMAKVFIPYKKEAQVYFQLKGDNSLIYAYRDANGFNVRLPKNREFTIVMMGFEKDTGPLFLKEQKILTQDETLDLQPQSSNLKQIKTALATL